ncbi:hypothetical protein [Superficieibacter sp.]|uniref:hypothetical protein n=1 Tax=Superficieibacter sp. TaxID=2303322 RepID=UPI0039184551
MGSGFPSIPVQRDYNVIITLHHETPHRSEEAERLSQVKRHLKKQVTRHDLTLPLLHRADYVLSDNHGFIFDAIHAGKRVILLENERKEPPATENNLFTPLSAEQHIRAILPIASDISQLRQYLSTEFNWENIVGPLADIRQHYCDAFQDGKAGERAAQVIMDAIKNPPALQENVFLHSLQQKLF